MSLPEFDSLLAQHPEDAVAISKLESVIVHSLRQDRNARFDLPLVLHHLRPATTPNQAKRLLVQLVKEHALQPLLFWECPNGNGPIVEVKDMAEFPDQIVCDRCTQVHWFDRANVAVGFIATRHLQEEIAEQSA